MEESVYLETSVIGALFDDRQDPVSIAQHLQTIKWHREEALGFDLFASAIVLEELKEGKYDHQPRSIAFAAGGRCNGIWLSHRFTRSIIC